MSASPNRNLHRHRKNSPQKRIVLEKCSLLTIFTAHFLVYSYAFNVLTRLVVLEPASAVRQRPLHLSSDCMLDREHLRFSALQLESLTSIIFQSFPKFTHFSHINKSKNKIGVHVLLRTDKGQSYMYVYNKRSSFLFDMRPYLLYL